MKRETKEFLISFVFPLHCAACGVSISYKKDGLLCHECAENFKPLLIKRELSNGVRVFSYCDYNDYSAAIVKNLKFKKYTIPAEVIGKKIAAMYKAVISSGNYLVIPAPVSKRRRRERGYNQSELIAKVFCEETGLIYDFNCLQKTKNTKAQSSLEHGNDRKSNVKGVFKVTAPERLAGKRIILIDDVITTGSTLLEITETLKPYVSEIICLTFASADGIKSSHINNLDVLSYLNR